MSTVNWPRRLPLKQLQMPPESVPRDGALTEAELCAFLLQVTGGTVPESVDAEMTAALVAMVITVMAESIQVKLGLEPEHARAAALGWLAAKAQGES